MVDYGRYHSPEKAKLDDKLFVPDISDGEYYETVSQVDYALDFLDEHEEGHSDKPFFLYLACYTPHFPLHALPKDIAKYKHTYTDGWDKIRELRWERIKKIGLVDGELSVRMVEFRNNWGLDQEQLKKMIDPLETLENKLWVDLTPDEQVFQAQKMAVHAAMVDRMDQEIGRLVQWLKDKGQFENTLIMFASDNGASSGLLTVATNTPRVRCPVVRKAFFASVPVGAARRIRRCATAKLTPSGWHRDAVHCALARGYKR